MDNQRLIPVFLLLVVLFLIWQRWVEFHGQKEPPPPQATAPDAPAAQAGTASLERLNLPSVAAPAETSAPAPDLPSARKIRVVTDIFEAEIDTALGDIRHVGLRTYPQSLDQPKQPFVLFKDTGSEIFIAQTGLLPAASMPAVPNHYGDSPQGFVAEQEEYRLKDGQDSLEVPLTWTDSSGLKVTKIYTFHRDSFVIDLDQRVENGSGQDWTGRQYRQFLRTPPVTKRSFFTGGVYTYTGGAVSTPTKHYEKISFKAMDEHDLNEEVTGGWVAMIQHYFLGAWIPDQDQANGFFPAGRPARNATYWVWSVRIVRWSPVRPVISIRSYTPGPRSRIVWTASPRICG